MAIHLRYATPIAVIVFLFYSGSVSANEKILQSAAALNTKPESYYEDIVKELEAKGSLGEGMEKFESAVSGIFKPYQVEDYHRLSLELYSKGYAEESEFVYSKYVAPAKKYSPKEGSEKAQKEFDRYQYSAGDPEKDPASGFAVSPVVQVHTWPNNTSFSRVTLKNGSSIDGHILEKDAKGLWLETEPGAKVYFSVSEYKEIIPL